jgi:hypothetical protein
VAIDTITPTSRRALLAGFAGGLTAAVVGTISRAQPASAHDPDDDRLGNDNLTASQTTITNYAANGWAFRAIANGTGIGVNGKSDEGKGVAGQSNYGPGVFGSSQSGQGVYGFSSGYGVYGITVSDGGSGVFGTSDGGGIGVTGFSGGEAATFGDNNADGIGVWARSAHGVGLFAEAANPDAVSLEANGVTRFSRSGRLTIAANQRSVTKTGIRVDAGTLVLATLQQNRPGVWIQSAVPHAAGDSFTIRLNKVVASAITVGWFLVN